MTIFDVRSSPVSNAAAANRPLLGAGSSGPDVSEVQTALQKLGLYHGTIDGIYGPKTRSAVEELQRRANLKPDGLTGPKTWAELEKRAPRPAPATQPQPSFIDLISTPPTSITDLLGPQPSLLSLPSVASTPAPSQPAPAAKPADPELARGAKNDQVSTLQRLLDDVGYDLRADGKFGPGTEEAVRLFQAEYELPETGKADAATWEALRKAAASADAGRIISLRSQGPDVEVAQQALTAAGFPLQVDGIFGPAMKKQVLAFQRARGLRETGVMNTSTWAALAVHPVGPPATATELRLGARGPEVLKIQRLLATNGYPVKSDSVFGQQTHAAVLRFQDGAGLPKSGVVDAATLARLEAETTHSPNPAWTTYNPGLRFPPGSPEQIALFEAAAKRAGVPLSWARSRGLFELLNHESEGGTVGIPNYRYGTNLPLDRWKEIHRELRAGRITSSGGARRSSATGLGQLLTRNARIDYPSGLDGIGVPLEEAVGMLRYIRRRHRNPDNAWRNHSKHPSNRGKNVSEGY